MMNRAEPVEMVADLFRLLGDATRLRVLLACDRTGEGVAAGIVAARAGASASLVSHHLRLLKAARLVRATRRGKQMLYAMADDHVRCVLRDMLDHARETEPGEDHGAQAA